VAAVIPGELVDLLHHLLLHCHANIWHAIETTYHYDYNLQLAINLKDFQYETLLLASGIFNKRGNLLCISRQHIEELQALLQKTLHPVTPRPRNKEIAPTIIISALENPHTETQSSKLGTLSLLLTIRSNVANNYHDAINY
jgi:hypothetical protein